MAETVKFKSFSSSFDVWEGLFGDAAEFATMIGRERVISISHSADNLNGVVTVWYWTNEDSVAPRSGQAN
ncbi:MAG: hypothetical protein AB7J13_01900 [Pyrinomonadaceae bacterium]